MARDRFQFLKSFADTIESVSQADKELAKDLAMKIINYGIYGIDEDSGNPILEALFVQIKLMIDKGNEISDTNSINGKRGGRPKKNWENEQKPNKNQNESETKAKKSKIENIKYKKENIKDKNNTNTNTNISISKDIETEIEISDSSKSNVYGNEFINTLLVLIKEKCNELGIAYDKQKERQYGRLILTAKEFGEFADKIGQTREEFAINILIASAKIGFWKGICSGPMKIYQNYADVYNETIKQHSKNQKNLIQSF